MPLLFATLALAPTMLGKEAAGLSIENVVPDTTVRTSALILRGRSPEPIVKLKGGGPEVAFPVVNGHWAGIVELKPGANMVSAKGTGALVRLKVTYRPMKTPRTVRAVYLLASDEEPGYLGNERSGEAEVRARFVTMLGTIQAFCAEAMEEAGYGRKAFALANDAKGRVAVDFIRLDLPGSELRKKDGNELYSLIEPILARRYDFNTTKTIALMGFTRYHVPSRTALAHTALGGGGLALFGTGPMRFWPTSFADLPRAFSDGRLVDPAVEFDDSGNRRRAWANAATTYGACLHELGHTLGLPHSPDPRDIMSRGFDGINRAWMLSEPIAGKSDVSFAPDTRSHWNPAWAMRLDLSPWFQPDGPPAPTGDAPKIEVVGQAATLTGTDLRVSGHWVEGPNFGVTQAVSSRLALESGPNTVSIPLADLLESLKPGEKLHLFAHDRFGREVDVVANP